jgi:hypothetical protein
MLPATFPLREEEERPATLTPWVAYRRFVKKDVVLTARALADFSPVPVNFKFLKYGRGFFAEEFQETIEAHIFSGVVDGLELAFREDEGVRKKTKALEFTFYDEPDACSDEKQKLDQRINDYKLTCTFSRNDALKFKAGCPFRTATTNCGKRDGLA